MIRLSDAVFISSEPDCDSVIAIRIKNGEYYFLGWMEDAEQTLGKEVFGRRY